MKQRVSIIGRAVGVLGLLVASVGGVTYAALTSNSVTLSNTSISTGTAQLRIYNFETNEWATEAPGFTIDNLVPGQGVEKSFYLQNSGTVPLAINARVPELPSAPEGGEFGFEGYENVWIAITGENCDATVNTNLVALNSPEGVALPCNPLRAGAAGNSGAENTEGNYDIKFDINPEVVNGSSAGVGDFDIVFTGTATAAPAEEEPDTEL